MVLRDRLVRREISDRDKPSRNYILRILPSVAMVITPQSPTQKSEQVRFNTLASFQPASTLPLPVRAADALAGRNNAAPIQAADTAC